ncbi:MAG: tyrosine-type recombinase/integrase [Planctomycetales bacterium]|nr:tyrosine-type recombinase/integrase [Planctomycetales bacterium]
MAAKTGRKFGQYDFRHARATQLLESGVDHLTVAKILGHSDGSMLARLYAHIGDAHAQQYSHMHRQV